LNYILLEPFIIKNNKSKIHLKCNKDKFEWYVSYDHFIGQKTGCPKCNSSKGEIKIEEYLKLNNIKYEFQKKFKECKNIKQLPFYFYISELNICVEYDGIQHYKPIKRFDGDEGLKQTQLRDSIKTQYCIDNNIELIRIPYFEKDNIENILKEKLKV
jgi:very-short-patch-repair endonuclease